MKSWKILISALGAAIVVAACGGGGAGDQTPKVSFSSMVNFGDSLSDVGSYKVGSVAALGGGKYTINGANAFNWTEILAQTYNLPAPCSAQVGLDGQGPNAVPSVFNLTCFGYGQGGARVTNPVGPGNKLLGGGNALLGQLTVPIKTQMTNHLANPGVNGKYKGTELVTVMAGGNDLFVQVATITPTIAKLVSFGQPLSVAQTTAITSATFEMGKAGEELAGYIKTLVLGNGAKYVVVVNIPKVSKTPYALAQTPENQALVDSLTKAFNTKLKAGLDGTGVVLADAYAESSTQAINPGPYGLTNVTERGCDINNLGGTALVCNASNTKKDATGKPIDVSHYQYADDVHPTPFGYELLAKFVQSEMVKAGLL
jgi:outer membrane lipase/esterase